MCTCILSRQTTAYSQYQSKVNSNLFKMLWQLTLQLVLIRLTWKGNADAFLDGLQRIGLSNIFSLIQRHLTASTCRSHNWTATLDCPPQTDLLTLCHPKNDRQWLEKLQTMAAAGHLRKSYGGALDFEACIIDTKKLSNRFCNCAGINQSTLSTSFHCESCIILPNY